MNIEQIKHHHFPISSLKDGKEEKVPLKGRLLTLAEFELPHPPQMISFPTPSQSSAPSLVRFPLKNKYMDPTRDKDPDPTKDKDPNPTKDEDLDPSKDNDRQKFGSNERRMPISNE